MKEQIEEIKEKERPHRDEDAWFCDEIIIHGLCERIMSVQ